MKQRFWWPTARLRGALLCFILIVGFALRVWLWWRTPVHQAANDEVEYLAVARDLLAGHGWRFYDTYHWLRAPLYPIWLAASLWLGGEGLRYVALPNIVLSSFTVYLYFLLGREVGESSREQAVDAARAEWVGLLTAGCAAVLLTLATFASLWMAETLFTALFIGSLLALLRSARQHSRQRLWLALSGVLLGLAILTRSLPLMALPAVALWVMFQRREAGSRHWWLPPRQGLLAALLFVLTTAGTIAPWTLRNYHAYGAVIPVETGLSYNLWWYNEPREDEDTIHGTLAAIANPAERADYATQKGLARLREDPAILLRKLWPNFNALWVVKPIEDRFLLTNYYQDVPFGMFAMALLLDDALYTSVAILGLSGLALAPLDRRKVLLGGWLLCVIAVVLLTHGEGRYRHFIFPVLLPYAAALLVALHYGAGWPCLRPRWLLLTSLLVVALLWTPLVLRYPAAWARTNLGRGWLVQRAEWAAGRGDAEEALRLYWRAHQADPRSVDVWLAIGNVQLRDGAVEQALSAFDSAFLISRSSVPVNVSQGDALRRLGRLDEARRAFKGYYTSELEMLEWAWLHLDTPPSAAVDVGDGLDFGFVDGMYAAEQQLGRTARWTKGQAALRLAGSEAGATIRLTLAAPRPDTHSVRAQICVGERCHDVEVTPTWRVYELAVPPADHYEVAISTTTFDPQALEGQASDSRRLGVLVDGAAVTLFDPAARPAQGSASPATVWNPPASP